MLVITSASPKKQKKECEWRQGHWKVVICLDDENIDFPTEKNILSKK